MSLAKRLVVTAEDRWDARRLRRSLRRPPEHFRIVTPLTHGTADRLLVRARVLDNPEPAPDVADEKVWAAVRRTLSRFVTLELPDVPIRVRAGGVEVELLSDSEGYVEVELDPNSVDTPWTTAEVELAAPYRGLVDPHTVRARVRVPGPDVAFGVISDIDDTILHTGAQRTWEMVRKTFTGSALTRTPFAGSAELYRALAGPVENPFFYVSSSPWNLHDFLVDFLEHRGFPLGPLLLRDLIGDGSPRSHGTHKHARIEEVLALHPDLTFVLVGDSGQHDPEIYAEVVQRHPGRIRAVYIREVRLDPGDGRVEAITDAWDQEVPFVLAADSLAVARHAMGLGLVSSPDVRRVEQALE